MARRVLHAWLLLPLVFAQEQPAAKYGEAIKILGNMERTDRDFTDGLALDLLSPKDRSVTVTQNTTPLDGRFVTGSTGGPWVGLLNYSWIVQTSDNSSDLIAKIECPYTQEILTKSNINDFNTYVGKLSSDGNSWVVDESLRNVHRSENMSRMVKLTSIDGEYRLLGRQTLDSAHVLIQYGYGATRTWNVSAGGPQEAEFIDGLRVHVETSTDLKVNIAIKPGINSADLPDGAVSLNPYGWVVNTTSPDLELTAASISIPFQMKALKALYPANTKNAAATVVFREAPTQPFRMPPGDVALARSGDRYLLTGASYLDGEYIILVNTGASPQKWRQMIRS